MEDLYSFQREIEEATKKKVQLRINNNRTTMLSVKWEPSCTKVSMHKMFLNAPKNIIEEVACHIRQVNSNVTPAVRAYIEENILKHDYSYTLDLSKLQTKGDVYDLKALYNEVNDEYFNNLLNLHITWFGDKQRRRRSRVTFGLYHASTRLIKIHRMLDRTFFPDYLVNFVIYHEMLHHVCPAHTMHTGRQKIHTEEFNERERQHRHYDRAKRWIDTHLDKLFMM
ncbi:MAG: hypothetical protein H7A37_09705 [Chlamydiales bacterium]|nr:hypothetical protein [Chlamydiia bacterium]MCP5508551.1 hypothetical protein [Chlamydiales bacterium]